MLNFDTNLETYGVLQNSSNFAMEFRGLGLPKEPFRVFENLLNVISNGEATCINQVGGFCLLTKTCESYRNSGLWDYDFKIKFKAQDNYLRVPLATFAANYDQEGGVCAIFVEYL